ncbi:hypothetical protein [Flavobacterium sp. I3-2]|uniref:hypothetical protein n=1 Tax=Flavobacterium sp. I3-2 TaxID=2748319 RepID=UPI0015A8C387|nr:hypothetical protein [Flavobacterium sp. I3-2]
MFKPVFPLASYIIQYDYIVNELCVNRDKPDLKCNGKCHLMKELAKASSENQKEGKDYKFPVFENVIFCEALYAFELSSGSTVIESEQIVTSEDLYVSSFHSLIFQPPINYLFY